MDSKFGFSREYVFSVEFCSVLCVGKSSYCTDIYWRVKLSAQYYCLSVYMGL